MIRLRIGQLRGGRLRAAAHQHPVIRQGGAADQRRPTAAIKGGTNCFFRDTTPGRSSFSSSGRWKRGRWSRVPTCLGPEDCPYYAPPTGPA